MVYGLVDHALTADPDWEIGQSVVLHAAPVVAGFITHKSVMDPVTRLFGSDYFASAVLRLLRRAKATASEGITRVGRVAW